MAANEAQGVKFQLPVFSFRPVQNVEKQFGPNSENCVFFCDIIIRPRRLCATTGVVAWAITRDGGWAITGGGVPGWLVVAVRCRTPLGQGCEKKSPKSHFLKLMQKYPRKARHTLTGKHLQRYNSAKNREIVKSLCHKHL